MNTLLDQGLAATHLLSGAAWFGALVYRTAFVDPKALKFLGGGSRLTTWPSSRWRPIAGSRGR